MLDFHVCHLDLDVTFVAATSLVLNFFTCFGRGVRVAEIARFCVEPILLNMTSKDVSYSNAWKY